MSPFSFFLFPFSSRPRPGQSSSANAPSSEPPRPFGCPTRRLSGAASGLPPLRRHRTGRNLLVQNPLEHDLVDLPKRGHRTQGQQQMHLALIVQGQMDVLSEGPVQQPPREGVLVWELVL